MIRSIVKWHYRDPPLVWLLVASYAAHLAEEYIGGFPEWFAVLAGRPMPRDVFVTINAVAFAAMAVAARAATRREGLGWLAIGIATILFVNGVAHLLASLATGTYSPGLITGVVLYVLLGQLALVRAWHQVPPPFFRRGVIAGPAAHAVVATTAVALS